jgi:hypothetical protein
MLRGYAKWELISVSNTSENERTFVVRSKTSTHLNSQGFNGLVDFCLTFTRNISCIFRKYTKMTMEWQKGKCFLKTLEKNGELNWDRKSVFCSGHNAHTLDKGSYRRTRSVVLYRCGIRYDPQSGFPGNLYREGTSYPIYIDVLENCVCWNLRLRGGMSSFTSLG